ncbi:MAG: hypothetical protein EKK55_23155 [Rhodocyclaceae bacterium]|nr:MAG: hypothetical protein EKK55_23155 [Rhodocyclaceae bacterium]
MGEFVAAVRCRSQWREVANPARDGGRGCHTGPSTEKRPGRCRPGRGGRGGGGEGLRPRRRRRLARGLTRRPWPSRCPPLPRCWSRRRPRSPSSCRRRSRS